MKYVKLFEEFDKVNEFLELSGESKHGKPFGVIVFTTNSQAVLFECELTGQFSDGAWENSGPSNHWEFWSKLDVTSVQQFPDLDPGIYLYEGNYGSPKKTNYNLASVIEYVGDRMMVFGRAAKAGVSSKEVIDSLEYVFDNGKTFADKAEFEDWKSSNRYVKDDSNGYWKKKFSVVTWGDVDKVQRTQYTDKEMRTDLKDISRVMKMPVKTMSNDTMIEIHKALRGTITATNTGIL